jgi:hypothetical protein
MENKPQLEFGMFDKAIQLGKNFLHKLSQFWLLPCYILYKYKRFVWHKTLFPPMEKDFICLDGVKTILRQIATRCNGKL